jgi:O-antigen/teichoic acid export membrane protein
MKHVLHDGGAQVEERPQDAQSSVPRENLGSPPSNGDEAAVGFVRQVLFTYLLRICLVPIGVLNAVIIARWLGPAGQGVFVAIGAYVATAAMCGSFGLPQAMAKLAASRPQAVGALAANARITGTAAGLAAMATLLLLRWAMPQAFAEVPFELLVIGALALPFNLIAVQLQALLLGLGRVRPYGFMESLDRTVLFLVSVVLLAGFGLGVEALVTAVTILAIVKLVLYERLVGPKQHHLRPDFRLLATLRGVSMRAYITSLLSFLVLRSDLILVFDFLGAASTGVYSVAVQFADLLLVLPGAIGTLLFPRVAASPSAESAAFTALVCRHTALVVAGGCLVVAAVIPWAIPALFGSAFAGAVPCLWILLPGVFCMSLEGILANDLAGRDYPAFLPWIWLALLTTNVVLNLLWLPTFGIVGAAAASTVAYSLSLALVARYWLRRFPSIRARSLLFLEASEVRALGGRVKAALSRA